MAIFNRIQLLYRIFTHRQAPWSVKLMMLAGFLYLIFPMDFIPDYIFIAGWLDDLLLAIIILGLSLKYTPEDLVSKIWSAIRDKNNG